jgi:hypothetical protein
MALTMAGAAFAFADNTYLNQTGTAIDGTTYSHDGTCAGHEPGPGEVTWHFVFTGSGPVNGHFAFSDGDQESLSEAQGAINTWWYTTDASVTLDGSATYTDGTGGEFNLSHTCVGATETSTPNVTPSPTLPEVTPTPTLPQTNTIDQSNTGGPGTSLTLVFALILAVAGGLVAYAMRPRRVGNR